MARKNTSNPFALFDQLTAARAAMELEEQQFIDVDRTRLERDVERRERLGQLRAREHPGKRPNRMVSRLFG
jgi:hypothetical protein